MSSFKNPNSPHWFSLYLGYSNFNTSHRGTCYYGRICSKYFREYYLAHVCLPHTGGGLLCAIVPSVWESDILYKQIKQFKNSHSIPLPRLSRSDSVSCRRLGMIFKFCLGLQTHLSISISAQSQRHTEMTSERRVGLAKHRSPPRLSFASASDRNASRHFPEAAEGDFWI